MNVIEVSHLAKSFGATQAVADVSFEVAAGEIFGLLGPNGAGKTTSIRLLLDIFKPDHGETAILGGPMSEAKKELIGYMPEERGLYQDIPLERCLLYLATLKGLSRAEARSRLGSYLERFDLATHRRKKVKELSKGMQQKAQIIATLLHAPKLVIIDEPFAALDPINTKIVKDLIRELQAGGTTILMSTHQMHQVEELCDRILLIHQGSNVLYGDLQDIRRSFASRAVLVRAATPLPEIDGVETITPVNSAVRLTLAEAAQPQDVLRQLLDRGVTLEKFEVALPPLDEIFIQAVKKGEKA